MSTPFVEGNLYAEKLKTDDLKREVYESYCAHIAKGYPQKAWYYDKDGIMLTANSMENYFKRYPELCVPGAVFDPIKKDVAHSKNMETWFDVLGDSAKGINPSASTASLQMIMRNVHGWDKPKDVKEQVKDGLVEGIREGIKAREKLAQALEDL